MTARALIVVALALLLVACEKPPTAKATPTGTATIAATASATRTAPTESPRPAPTSSTVPTAPPAVSTPTARASTPVASVAPAVFYQNCDAARAAGAAPIRRGQPGYRAALDRDNDGIACE